MAHDLDAARAARAEVRGQDNEDRTVILGGERYVLKAELPVSFVDRLRLGQMEAAVGLLLDDAADAPAFLSNAPTMEDLVELAEVYGVAGLGEYLASGTSSTGTSRPSKPTSSRTTGSTSAKPSGGKRR